MKDRVFIADLASHLDREVRLCGWVHRLRPTKSTTFIVLQDCSGRAQIVADPALVRPVGLKTEDALTLRGRVRREERARLGYEVDALELEVVGSASATLPFTSASDLTTVGQEVVLDHRPLSLRTDRGHAVFTVHAALIEAFRSALRARRFTEICSSKIVAGGTEGGSNLFEIRYFDRAAYLAQSPQFFKEYGVCGLERVFETGQVFRAEPHATSRHLTEFYSLDLEMGFISGVREVIELEREVLGEMFESLRSGHAQELAGFDAYLPALEKVPVWDFAECVERLQREGYAEDLSVDLTPEAERRLCAFAERDTGVAAVFVVGYPLAGRPFYTQPRSDGVTAEGFDLLFRGVEITTGGQRIHRRDALKLALTRRGIDATAFEPHLLQFEMGMPPHGGLALGAERVTAQVLGLSNVREATLYPRDRQRLTP